MLSYFKDLYRIQNEFRRRFNSQEELDVHGKTPFEAILQFLFVLLDNFQITVDDEGFIGDVRPTKSAMYLSLGQGGSVRHGDGRVTSHGICLIKTFMCIILHGGEVKFHPMNEV